MTGGGEEGREGINIVGGDGTVGEALTVAAGVAVATGVAIGVAIGVAVVAGVVDDAVAVGVVSGSATLFCAAAEVITATTKLRAISFMLVFAVYKAFVNFKL